MKLILNLIILISLIGLINCYGESDSQGNPNYLERESHNLINLCRMFPTSYKTDYMSSFQGLDSILTPSVFPAVSPVLYDNTLNRMAKAHSYDMATNDCFDHNDCVNASSPSDRFKRWGTCTSSSYGYSENIASGTPTGISTNNLLICEESSGPCPSDNNEYLVIGHRTNIMGPNYEFVGVGYYSQYWTQNFIKFSPSCTVKPNTPIYSGFHTFYPSISSNPTYLVNFYGSSKWTANKVQIILGGNTYDMTLKYGNTTFGYYSYSSAFVDCSQYYFQATTTSGSTFRYPETGYLQTTKSTSCPGWSSTSSGTSSATSSTPTDTSSGASPTPSVTPSQTSTGGSSPTPSVTPSQTSTGGSSNTDSSLSSENDGSDISQSNILKSNLLYLVLVLLSIYLL